MKIAFVSFLFVANVTFSQTTENNNFSQDNVNKIITEISKVIIKNSLFTDSLNWVVIKDSTQKISGEIKSAQDYKLIYSFFTKELRRAGDKHSFFLSTDNITKIQNQSNESKQPEGKYLGDSVGYVKVPGCLNLNSEKDIAFAENIRLKIKEIDTENKVTSWIVDLRHNTGGNMWPMLAGLNALTKDGVVGYFVTSRGESGWKIKNGEIVGLKQKIDNYKIKNPNVKIAVLIDSLTGSSGEMTAISFSGLPNVKFFGIQSAGYTTANNTFNLSNGGQLYLASGFVADRNHKSFMNKIIPDVLVEGNNDKNDIVLATAMQWAKETK
jgi:carboxyl-terminal processing protease